MLINAVTEVVEYSNLQQNNAFPYLKHNLDLQIQGQRHNGAR